MRRRTFLKTTSIATIAAAVSPPRLFAGSPTPKIAVGLDNYSIRSLGWKAPQLIDYAASIKCDTLFISDLDAYESLDDAALRVVRGRAEKAGLALYVGGWSVCPTSHTFKKNWGTAEEHLRLGIRVAQTLGSPVFRAVLGDMEDRKSAGGIQARIADTVAVLKACRAEALAAGVGIAIENHAGDMHSWELRGLIEAAGADFVGANIDSGNAAWTLEDPLDVLETLGPVTICSSLRDDMIWETAEGATVQWTAVGEGLIDWKAYTARWSQLCPQVPIMIETISGAQRTFAYKQPDFWKYYDKRPDKLAKFEALAKRGRPLPPVKAPAGADAKEFARTQQKAEIEKSIAYLRTELGLGRRP
jgi:sugar phosphate isomerase/epimerase